MTRGWLRVSAAAVLLTACPSRGEDAGWQTLKGEHFLVHHQGDAAFAAEVLREAEACYDGITHDLGIERRDRFWLWDRRVHITLHSTREAFLRATGAPSWAGGKASYQKRAIDSFEGSPDLLDSLLPHEMTHLVFRDFVGGTRAVPLWLDEGTAQWEERTGAREAACLARELCRQGRFVPLRSLMESDVRRSGSHREAEEFYAQARSLVAFLVKRYGRDRFRVLCGQIRLGKSFEEALRFTYPDRLRTLEQLEQEWKQSLKEETP
jgi:hypothetical protein